MDTTPASAEYLAFVLAVLKRWPQVSASQMFGVPNLTYGQKAFAGGYAGGAVFRLPPADYLSALELDGAEPFDPAERGAPMSTWVVLPASSSDCWLSLAAAALRHLPDAADPSEQEPAR